MAQHVLDRRSVLDHRRSGALSDLTQHVDAVLVFATVAMAGLGVLMVYSATRAKLLAAGIDPHYYLKKQGTYALLGIAVMVVVTLIDYHRLEEWALVVYGVVVIGLLGVLSPLGHNALGASRWFQIGSFALQPSSFASLAVIVCASVYCARHQGDMGLRNIFVLLGLAAIPILLVIKEPDLGTAIIMTVVLVTILIVAGVKARHLALLLLLGAIFVFGAVH
ncbi:MAG: FtsW/RodA/SpoVE family cell cycle protein, partial [Acidimicrobiales bacterium]